MKWHPSLATLLITHNEYIWIPVSWIPKGSQASRQSFSAHRSKPSAFSTMHRQFVSAFFGASLPELPLPASIYHYFSVCTEHCRADCCLLPGPTSYMKSPAGSLDPATELCLLSHLQFGPGFQLLINKRYHSCSCVEPEQPSATLPMAPVRLWLPGLQCWSIGDEPWNFPPNS